MGLKETKNSHRKPQKKKNLQICRLHYLTVFKEALRKASLIFLHFIAFCLSSILNSAIFYYSTQCSSFSLNSLCSLRLAVGDIFRQELLCAHVDLTVHVLSQMQPPKGYWETSKTLAYTFLHLVCWYQVFGSLYRNIFSFRIYGSLRWCYNKEFHYCNGSGYGVWDTHHWILFWVFP